MKDVYRMVTKYLDYERKCREQAKREEKLRVNINPDGYVAKQIFYMVALLHELKGELEELKEGKTEKALYKSARVMPDTEDERVMISFEVDGKAWREISESKEWKVIQERILRAKKEDDVCRG